MNTARTIEGKKKTLKVFPVQSTDLCKLFGSGSKLNREELKLVSRAVALGRRYLFDERHGLQVARLSVSLFDQTIVLHGLGKKERLLLLVAGVVHDIGMFVGCRKHHKHSMHLISQNGIPGFSPCQIRVIAQVARYHRKSNPSSKHVSFFTLPKKDRALVKTLSAILRIGDVLDREHLQNVVSVVSTISRDALTMRIKGKSGLFLDHPAIEDKVGLFEKFFGLKVSLSRGQAI